MAEAYINKLSSGQGILLEARSAGTLGIEGAGPSKEVIDLLLNEEIDPSGYGSKGLSKEMIEWADLILVMARNIS
jgi:protein-tyrosine-phosphatase